MPEYEHRAAFPHRLMPVPDAKSGATSPLPVLGSATGRDRSERGRPLERPRGEKGPEGGRRWIRLFLSFRLMSSATGPQLATAAVRVGQFAAKCKQGTAAMKITESSGSVGTEDRESERHISQQGPITAGVAA